jgi:hypothetical protein
MHHRSGPGSPLDAETVAQVVLPVPFATIPTRGGYMAALRGLESIVSQLREQRTSLVNELRHVDAALAVLGKLEGGRSYSEPRRHGRRKMSAAGRRRISLAQTTRWAKHNSTGRAGARPKRHVSTASRRKMAVAQRARWARFNQRKAA